MTERIAFDAVLRQCRLHATVLNKALDDLEAVGLPDDPAEWTAETLRILDQLAYRFGKLQDSLGEKVLPGILERAQEPLASRATFAEKLQRLERLCGWGVPVGETGQLALKRSTDCALAGRGIG